MVSMSDFGTRGPGSIPGWALITNCFFFLLLFSLVMQTYFIQVIWNYINDQKKVHSFIFHIELSSKFVGVGLNLAFLKEDKYGDPRFFSFS